MRIIKEGQRELLKIIRLLGVAYALLLEGMEYVSFEAQKDVNEYADLPNRIFWQALYQMQFLGDAEYETLADCLMHMAEETSEWIVPRLYMRLDLSCSAKWMQENAPETYWEIVDSCDLEGVLSAGDYQTGEAEA